jgi:hypothetical protein
MLFEEFVKQHRVDLLVANGFGMAFPIASDQIGIYFGYFLGDETKGNGLGRIVILVLTETHKPKRVKHFAGFVH